MTLHNMIAKIAKIMLCSVMTLFVSSNMFSAQSLVFNEVDLRATLPPGQQYYEFSYVFVNKGTDTVKITKVELSCGCSSHKIKKYDYAPGEYGVLNVIVDIKGYGGQAYVGAIVETDEVGGLYKLQGFVFLPELITVTPRMLRWLLGDEMKEKRFEVKLKAEAKDHALSIRDVLVDKEHFVVRVEPVEEGKRYFVYVRPKQNVKCASMIRVLTKPEGPEGGFPVVAYVGEKRDKL